MKNRSILALFSEYNRAIKDFNNLILSLSLDDFMIVRDHETKDPDCVSIQSISNHVVKAGYTYANYFFELSNGNWFEYEGNVDSPNRAIAEIQKMMKYTITSLEPLLTRDNESLASHVIKARWGVTFDFDQLFEHAIVHILRHRRQIENFLEPDKVLELKTDKLD